MQEIWKDIAGYEGLYQVSNYGKVKSLNYNHTKTEKVLCKKQHKSNYVTVMLCKNGENKNKSIHILVASAFIPNPNSYPCVNHIDGNKKNNNVDNLEWCTHKQNIEHAIKTGLANHYGMLGRTGAKNKLSKKIVQYDLQGNVVNRWDCISDAARFYGVRPGNINNCLSGRNKTYKGYIWRYAGE